MQHVAQLDLAQIAANVGDALNRHRRIYQHVLLIEEMWTHHLGETVRLLLLDQRYAVYLLQREGNVHYLVAALPARRQVYLVDDLVAVRDEVPLRQLADLIVCDDARLQWQLLLPSACQGVEVEAEALARWWSLRRLHGIRSYFVGLNWAFGPLNRRCLLWLHRVGPISEL